MDIVVHGGAGDTGSQSSARQAVLDEAANEAVAADTPLDAVEHALNVLERAPDFNAGRGGAVQSDGVIRTDAGMMDSDGTAGAACAMPGVARASSVARIVMTETPHVLVAGERAVDVASSFGIETGVDLWTARRREQWSNVAPPAGDARAHLAWLRDRFGGFDTVGAVAGDGTSIVAGTSTGGRWLALAGRVGDVPQIGSGFFCSPAGGASTTGAGEAIATHTLARVAVDALETGDSPNRVANRVIERFHEETGETAGIILCDRAGRIGSAATTDGMQTSHASR